MQGFLFAFVGMCAGLTGTAISNALLVLRQKLDPNFKSQNEAPNVPLNAATWAAHMGISSNVRYQVLNGLDMVSIYSPRHVAGVLSMQVMLVRICIDLAPSGSLQYFFCTKTGQGLSSIEFSSS